MMKPCSLFSKLALCSSLAFAALTARGESYLLRFEGVGENVEVTGFYQGGPEGNYNLYFTNVTAVADPFAGELAGRVTGSLGGFFHWGGFDTQISFHYKATSDYTLTLHSGTSESSLILESVELAATPTWTHVVVDFDGTAKSLFVEGEPHGFIFDNIWIGVPPSAIPEPSTWAALAGGAALLGAISSRYRRSRP